MMWNIKIIDILSTHICNNLE